MSQKMEVLVPDIGDFSAIPVIETAVAVGDTIKVDDTLVTLESDKATMDVPSSAAGVVKEVLVQLGDRVSVYLDGGTAPGGVASTIVDFASTPDGVVLRDGALSLEMLREHAPTVAPKAEQPDA